ncbi:6-hydroxymethyl-7,8-dihydropterin pyrophosphokinase [Thermococcus sp. EP1]|uniref:6-hydroxymethylpterin diphosphokinase MptE-like protein n=1 Tax=Thermococcus sp. EP1 TaxID=1591054 RepID=UPI0006DB608A|nr:6-hydroxymethylpterin diphosphokinase MptE-like protein [Thermococcus sp. EP1]KPU63488.1 6-hydroxymethyl-7,8-dihydropterin pyrophosphokinase [Thermococcus sp. EP1]
MKWSEWEPFYQYILEVMGYDREADKKAALLLRELLLKSKNYVSPTELKERIREQVYVFGPGPSLDEKLNRKFDGTLIASDGATSALLENNIIPHIIVTDLDGRFEDIKRANELGSIVVVHAHGDNMDKLRMYVPRLKNVLGTCQTESLDIIYNFGGFTDGDRAAFLAEELGAKRIFLVGFDFGDVVGKWSKPYLKEHTPVWETKRKKFEIAQMLLEWLKKNGRAKIVEL